MAFIQKILTIENFFKKLDIIVDVAY